MSATGRGYGAAQAATELMNQVREKRRTSPTTVHLTDEEVYAQAQVLATLGVVDALVRMTGALEAQTRAIERLAGAALRPEAREG